MLGENDEAVRDKGASKYLHFPRTTLQFVLFHHPTLILKADTYYEFVDMELSQQQPPALTHLSGIEIEDCRTKPLVLRLKP